MTPAPPLAVLGPVDAAFSGFGAHAGRDPASASTAPPCEPHRAGRPPSSGRSPPPTRRAPTPPRPGRRRRRLPAPAHPHAAAALLPLAACFLLPFRAGALSMVIGLGPLTLLRAPALAAVCPDRILNGGSRVSLLVGAPAGTAVLSVEPAVHRRWCRGVCRWPGSEAAHPSVPSVMEFRMLRCSRVRARTREERMASRRRTEASGGSHGAAVPAAAQARQASRRVRQACRVEV